MREWFGGAYLAGPTMRAITFFVCLLMALPALARDWNANYIGFHAGASRQEWGINTANVRLFPGFWSFGGFDEGPADRAWSSKFEFSDTVGFGGVQISLMREWGNLVLGVEGSYSHSVAGIRVDPVGTRGGLDNYVRLNLKSRVTAAARIGWNAGNFMPYAKIGYAAVQVVGDASDTDSFAIDRFDRTTVDSRKHGLVIGAGVELLLNQSWSARLEWDHLDLNKFQTTNLEGEPFSHKIITQNVTLGLNYRF